MLEGRREREVERRKKKKGRRCMVLFIQYSVYSICEAELPCTHFESPS